MLDFCPQCEKHYDCQPELQLISASLHFPIVSGAALPTTGVARVRQENCDAVRRQVAHADPIRLHTDRRTTLRRFSASCSIAFNIAHHLPVES